MFTTLYQVAPNDTFTSIAQKFNVSVYELAKLNHIQGTVPLRPNTSQILIPLVGNGGQDVESYWANVSTLLGMDNQEIIQNAVSVEEQTKNSSRAYTPTNAVIPGVIRDNIPRASYKFSSVGEQTISLMKGSNNFRYPISSPRSPYKITGKIVENVNCWIQIGNNKLIMPCYPQPLTDSRAAQYNQDIILGRTQPLVNYRNNDARLMPFTFKLHREMTGNLGEIDNIVSTVLAGVYPVNSSGSPCQRTTVHVGNHIHISGVMTDAKAEYDYPIIDGKFNQIILSLTILEVTSSEANVPIYDNVRTRGSYYNL